MMEINHPLNIGTLAVWLSVSGFGAVGLLVPLPEPPPPRAVPASEIQISDEGFTLGGESSPTAETPSADPMPQPVPLPPEVPQLAEIEPLPELPGFPAEVPQTTAPKPAIAPAAGGGAPVARANKVGTRRSAPAAAQGGGGGSGSGSSGLSNSARVAAGRMPSPSYPPYSRRNQQQGTVIVEFTVDESGRVISAYAKKPSPWPLLNNEAVSTVRLWRFPPGGVMTLQRPIVFELR